MKTRQEALEAARTAAGKSPGQDWAIYRVGMRWMFTSENMHVVQSNYAAPIRNWELVHRPGVKSVLDQLVGSISPMSRERLRAILNGAD